MAVRYTVAQCEAKIATIEAKIEELQGLPTRGTVGKTTLDHSSTIQNLEAQLSKWQARLEQAHRFAGTFRGRRRREI